MDCLQKFQSITEWEEKLQETSGDSAKTRDKICVS